MFRLESLDWGCHFAVFWLLSSSPPFDISNTCGNVSDLFSNLNKHFELDSGVCLHLSNDLFIVTLGCRVMFTTINPNQKAGLDILTVVYILKLNWLKSWVLQDKICRIWPLAKKLMNQRLHFAIICSLIRALHIVGENWHSYPDFNICTTCVWPPIVWQQTDQGES